MGKTFQRYLSKNNRTYSCKNCRAHLADHEDLISKSFQGSQGRAYLFNHVINVGTGKAEGIFHKKSVTMIGLYYKRFSIIFQRATIVDWPACSRWYILRVVQVDTWLEVRASFWGESKVQGGKVHHWTDTFDQGQRLGGRFHQDQSFSCIQ